jgi:hypothetical protein
MPQSWADLFSWILSQPTAKPGFCGGASNSFGEKTWLESLLLAIQFHEEHWTDVWFIPATSASSFKLSMERSWAAERRGHCTCSQMEP